MPDTLERRQFFVSYAKPDESWATWIAETLEAAGYSVFIQAWDFVPGANFVLEMQNAAARAERTIAVLSPDFLNSRFTPAEWAAAFAQDPTSQKRQLVPVRIRPCELTGLLAQIIYIDLVGKEVATARELLLAGVNPIGPLRRAGGFPGSAAAPLNSQKSSVFASSGSASSGRKIANGEGERRVAPLRIFVHHTIKDTRSAEELRKHLQPLIRKGLLALEAPIAPGAVVAKELNQRLTESDVLLALVSADYLADEECDELLHAALTQKPQALLVVPVLLSPASIEHSPLAGVKALPASGRAISQWDSRDAAWQSVVEGLHSILRGGTHPGL